MSQLADDLRAAKALIDTPEKWCKGSYHHDGMGDAHCIVGAVMVVTPEYSKRRNMALEAIGRQTPQFDDATSGFMPRYNDAPTTTHADIMALFDRAIAAAEAEA